MCFDGGGIGVDPYFVLNSSPVCDSEFIWTHGMTSANGGETNVQ